MDEHALAEQLPTLYRSILDGVARLERAGERAEAARIRADATRAYSRAWDERSRTRLQQLLERLERSLLARRRAVGGAGVLSRHSIT